MVYRVEGPERLGLGAKCVGWEIVNTGDLQGPRRLIGTVSLSIRLLSANLSNARSTLLISLTTAFLNMEDQTSL